jgi:spermidine synthase
MWLAKKDTPEPRALVIGGGGYTFPRYAQEIMPKSHVDVVEIDPKVTWVAREHLGLKDYPNLRAIHMDGRQFVAEKAVPGSYDLVIQDAVNDLSVPAHLMTKEYNDAVKAVLKPGGAYLLTIIDSVEYGKLWKAAMATLQQSFPAENVVLLRVRTDGENWYESRHVLVIYASDKPFSIQALQNSLPKPTAIEAIAQLNSWLTTPLETPDKQPVLPELQFALNALRFSAIVYNISTNPQEPFTVQAPPELLKRFTDREPGVILTDQYCPVDNLMAEVFRKR